MIRIYRLTINIPILKDVSVGVNSKECERNDFVIMDIAYAPRGIKKYPGYYKISTEKAKKYPLSGTENKFGVGLRIIPIDHFKHFKTLEEAVRYKEPESPKNENSLPL